MAGDSRPVGAVSNRAYQGTLTAACRGTDAYFDDGTLPITLPWQVDERPKAERHYGGEQTSF